MSTAEAELNAAALAWQIVEGIRLLIGDFGYRPDSVRILIDNKAALTIAECGATWRTRYFAVRGHRLHEEHSTGRAILEHCKTDVMLADALTKLAPAGVISLLHSAMHSEYSPNCPTVASARAEQVTSSASVDQDLGDKDPVFELDPWSSKSSSSKGSSPPNLLKPEKRIVKKFKLAHLWGMITCMILRLIVLPSVPSITESALVPTLYGKMQPARAEFSDNRDRLLPTWIERATQPTHPLIEQDANAEPGDYLPEIKQFLDRRSAWIPDEDYRFIYGFVGYLDETADFTHTVEHPSATKNYISVGLARRDQVPDVYAQPGWVRVFHGTSFYALTGVNPWGLLAGTDPDLHGILAVEGKLLVGDDTTPFFATAVGYATPHRMFGTERWFRVVLEPYGR